MSSLMKPPKPHAENIAAIADFAEIECLRRADGNVSMLDISRIIQRQGDGVDDGEESISSHVSDAFAELESRSQHCGPDDDRYPFEISDDGSLLQLRECQLEDAPYAAAYFYLLLATRMNMNTERHQGGEDATKLFELFCREVAIRYWGGPGDSIQAIVFGTGRLAGSLDDEAALDRRGFTAAVDDLCRKLGEGYGFRNDNTSRITAKDGKLDVVVWRPFADGRAGQLIGFGQCKTGTHWQNDLTKLRPEGFYTKWVRKHPGVLPIRMYFITDRVIARWYDHCVDAGIVFDRCRIMEYATDLPVELTKRVANWVKAACVAEELNLS